jgi:hypothetical protein
VLKEVRVLKVLKEVQQGLKELQVTQEPKVLKEHRGQV